MTETEIIWCGLGVIVLHVIYWEIEERRLKKVAEKQAKEQEERIRRCNSKQ